MYLAIPRKRLLAPPRLEFSTGSIEVLKWLALLLMTLDHVNTFLYDRDFPVLYRMGRVAMPLFGFVLAYKLARSGTLANGAYGRVMKRLAVFGLLASPMYVAMVGWQPLNIMFTLLVAVAVMYLIEKGGRWRVVSATVLFFACGAYVDFSWFGVLHCLAAWCYCKRPDWPALSAWVAATAALYTVNGNLWALAALPVILVASRIDVRMPRHRFVFYAYYPAHLAVLWGLGYMP
jgi:hypothetical protein